VNLPPIEKMDKMIIIFITRRNTVVPIASKLTIEQAAAAFMFGESVETSAGDPRRAGESVREVGTNPFIVGDETYEGNWFYDFLKAHSKKIQCYLLNTGGVGENRKDDDSKEICRKPVRVEIPEMAAIIRGIVKGSIEWTCEPYFNTLVPKKVNGMQMTRFDPSEYYSKEEIDAQVAKLKQERFAWLKRFESLNPTILML
jgi:phosphoenolpyruvate carboxykinase (ATP)